MNTRKLVLTGLMTALVFAVSYVVQIRVPGLTGYYGIGDSIILLTASLLGPIPAGFAGAFGSLFSDISVGYAVPYAPYTFVIKGLEGIIVALLIYKKDVSSVRKIIAFSIGTLMMVIGYFISEALIINSYFTGYGATTAITNLPFNVIQAVLSVIAAFFLCKSLEGKNIVKDI